MFHDYRPLEKVIKKRLFRSETGERLAEDVTDILENLSNDIKIAQNALRANAYKPLSTVNES